MKIAKREEERLKEKAWRDEEYHAARMQTLKAMSDVEDSMNVLDTMNPFMSSM